MKIYTSYFAMLDKIPSNLIPIAICGKSPDWYNGLEYKVLAPKWKFFQEWKQNHDNNFYIKCFNEQVLADLSPERIIYDLKMRGDEKDVVLLCYEKPDDFCHRHLVADWLTKKGYEVKEYNYGQVSETCK